MTAMLPYATFGDAIGLDRYRDWAERRELDVVIDAAAGQANGLWLWQNDVGMMIVDQLLREAERAAA